MRNFNLSAAVLIGALALTGCSRNPVAPQVVVPTDPSATLGRGIQTDEPEAPQGGEAGMVGTIHVEAMGAGVLTVGRWTLTIHKNSHIDPAMISMTIRDPQAMEVEIQVSPASANVFQVPIELVANCTDQTNLIMDDQAIFFFNEGWEQAPVVTVQEGSMLIKAKSSQLSNAMVSSATTIHNGNKKN
jgi:hypothetical protein